jgi:hypothetical protein
VRRLDAALALHFGVMPIAVAAVEWDREIVDAYVRSTLECGAQPFS